MYTGEVSPGGSADVRELPDVAIRKVSVGTTDNNCYLLTCARTGEQLLIDAADDAPRLLRLVAEGGGEGLSRVVTTHQHWDHHRALPAVVSETGARTAAGRLDADALPVPVDEPLDHGDTVNVGEVQMKVVHLRATPPSVASCCTRGCAPTPSHRDSLFPGGSATRSAARRTRPLIDDGARLFDAAGRHLGLPWHGKNTTLGAERPSPEGANAAGEA
jgi:hypothetical protein